MTAEPGGRAEKLGHRYEGRWVALNLLGLLRGWLTSLTLEVVGDEGKGVDLWVRKPDGTREAHQCKLGHALRGKWTMNDLAHRGVLAALKNHLLAGENRKFVFVSGDPAPEFDALCQRAQSSNGNPNDFVKYQVGETKKLREAFGVFCKTLDLDSAQSDDLAIAYDLLRRSGFDSFPANLEKILYSLADSLTYGDPAATVSLLADYAESRLGDEIHLDELRSYLTRVRHKSRDLSLDPDLGKRFETLQEEFVSSCQQLLIDEHIIPRHETQKIIQHVSSGATGAVIVLHGRAGFGKSSVLLEFANHLIREKVPFLPIRLDRRPPQLSAKQIGLDMGLPDSPVFCLASIAVERRSVLILDQLDAIRWTTSHASASWEAIQEVITQAKAATNVSVVIACRTFDLETDPQLKAWRQANQCVAVEVGPLDEESVRNIVTAHGDSYDSFDKRQQTLLAQPDCLKLWSVLRAVNENMGAFGSRADLLRDFWTDRHSKAEEAGILASESREFLDVLLDRMDRNGTLSAPRQCFTSYPKALKCWQSLGVIAVDKNTVTFCHQSYGEYLQARRLCDAFSSGKQDILGWLGTEQGLVRREKIRLLFSLLRVEDAETYIASVRALLDKPNIRFHIKQLVVDLLGSATDLSPDEVSIVCELLSVDEWRETVLVAIQRKPEWFKALSGEGVLSEWLCSVNERQVNEAVWTISRCVDLEPDIAANLLRPFRDQGKTWPSRIAGCLPYDPAEDNAELFEWRLDLTRKGMLKRPTHSYELRALARNNPRRCVDFLEAALERFENEFREDAEKPRLELYYDEGLSAVADAEPALLLDRLIPHVERIARAVPPRYKDDQSFVDDGFWSSNIYHHQGESVVEHLIVQAGKALAEQSPHEFTARHSEWSISQFRVTQRLLASMLCEAPTHLADYALSWITKDTRRFAIKESFNVRHEYTLACRLISHFAKDCSPEVFEALEHAILLYRDPNEVESIRHYHPDRMNGIFWPNYFGTPRHLLLPALPEERLSPEAKTTFDMFERKLNPDKHAQEARQFRPHIVRSPLTTDARERLSDRTWLRLIHDVDVAHRKGRDTLRSGRNTEFTPEQFAVDLGKQAKAEPARFAKLAMRFDPDMPPAYRTAILDALADNQESSEANDAVSPLSLNSVLMHFGYADNPGEAKAWCRVIEKHAEIPWCDDVLDILAELATRHADPSENDSIIRRSATDEPPPVGDLEMTAINCVRGCAASAIARISWERPELLTRFGPIIEQLAADKSAAVRVAALDAITAVVNHDESRALSLFLTATDCSDDRVSASREAKRFIRYMLPKHPEQLEPLCLRMLESKHGEVVRSGAAWVTVAHIAHRDLCDFATECLTGNTSYRLGVVDAAIGALAETKHAEHCRPLLLRLFRDDDEGVLRAASEAFCVEGIFETEIGRDLAIEYASSPAFRAASGSFIFALEHYTGSLLELADVVFCVVDELSRLLGEKAADRTGALAADARYIPSLLLRIYDQAEQQERPDLRERALDSFDALLRANVSDIRTTLDRL